MVTSGHQTDTGHLMDTRHPDRVTYGGSTLPKKQCIYFRYFSDKACTMTIRRQMLYSISVQAKISQISLLPETVFTCTMVIPRTPFSLVKKMMYYNSTMVAPRVSLVAGAEHLTVWGGVLGVSVCLRHGYFLFSASWKWESWIGILIVRSMFLISFLCGYN
jgi:hypothetical protein